MKKIERSFCLIGILVAVFIILPIQVRAMEPFGLRRAVTETITKTVQVRSYDYPEYTNRVTYTVRMTYFVNDNTGEIVDAYAPVVSCTFEDDLEDEIEEGVQYRFESRRYLIDEDAQSVNFYFRVYAEDPYNKPSPSGGVYDILVHYIFEDSFTYYAD